MFAKATSKEAKIALNEDRLNTKTPDNKPAYLTTLSTRTVENSPSDGGVFSSTTLQ
jgi:hypothetical protein